MLTKSDRIASDLRKLILSGVYPPGSTLPPTPELVTRYGAARDAIRDAVAALTNDGLVTPLRGIGTVVREITPVALGYTPTAPARTWSQQLGAEQTDVVVAAAWELTDTDIAQRLNLDSATEVLHRTRHQSKGAGIAQIHDQWIPGPIVDAITANGTDFSDRRAVPATDLFSLMRLAGHQPSEVTETISARMPDPTERNIMGLPPRVPVLITIRVTRDGHGAPVETSTIVSASDRVSQSFTLPLRR